MSTLLIIINQDVRTQRSKALSEKIRIKKHILVLNKEINRLLEEANSTSVSKVRKEDINTELLDTYKQ